MKTKRLLIISGNIDYSQHVGGVGMHVHRLLKKLVEPEVPLYETSDYRIDGILTQLKKISRADVVHLHVSNPYMRFLFAITIKLMGKTSVLTVHGNYGRFRGLKSCADRMALQMVDEPVLINKESYEKVHGFNKRAVYIPAFIIPIEGEEILAKEVETVISEIKKDGKPIVVTSTNRRAFTDEGKEIYGIDFLVKYFTNHNKYNFFILDPFSEYKYVYEGEIPYNIKIISGPYSFCGMMRMADYVIRNTATDGDAFSVKEALWLHKPIIVSDVVSRPEGVFLFHYCDNQSLEKAMEKAENYKGEISLKENDGVDGYRGLYQQLRVLV